MDLLADLSSYEWMETLLPWLCVNGTFVLFPRWPVPVLPAHAKEQGSYRNVSVCYLLQAKTQELNEWVCIHTDNILSITPPILAFIPVHLSDTTELLFPLWLVQFSCFSAVWRSLFSFLNFSAFLCFLFLSVLFCCSVSFPCFLPCLLLLSTSASDVTFTSFSAC